eukprot:24520-Eustigmatos_ZCMA.PRE.1
MQLGSKLELRVRVVEDNNEYCIDNMGTIAVNRGRVLEGEMQPIRLAYTRRAERAADIAGAYWLITLNGRGDIDGQ